MKTITLTVLAEVGDRVSIRDLDCHATVKAGAKFATITIDPPWDWGDEGDCDQLGWARPTYGMMTFDKLKALPLSAIAFASAISNATRP